MKISYWRSFFPLRTDIFVRPEENGQVGLAIYGMTRSVLTPKGVFLLNRISFDFCVS